MDSVKVVNAMEGVAQAPTWLERVRVADVLFAAVLLLASVLRLAALDAVPLSAEEATAALSNWDAWQPQGVVATIPSPAYFTYAGALSQVIGFADASARLVPALFGIATVALTWWWRKQAGYLAALTAAAFMAVSPLLTLTARSAGGDSIALFAVFLVAIAGSRLMRGGGVAWLYVLAGGVAIGMASATLFYSGATTLVLAYLAWARLSDTPGPARPALRPNGRQWRLAGIGWLIIFVLSSTMFLRFPRGLAASFGLLAEWLANFGWPAPAANFPGVLGALVRYEPAWFVLGSVAVLWVAWQRKREAAPLLVWIAAGLLVLLLQPGVPGNALLPLLSGYLLIGRHAGFLWERPMSPFERRVGLAIGAGICFLGLLLLINLARFTRLVAEQPQELRDVWLALGAFVVGAVVLFLFWSWYEPMASRGAWAGLAVLLIFFQWGASWYLGHEGAARPQAPWILEATDRSVYAAVRLIRDVSQQTGKSHVAQDVFSLDESVPLKWYLREYEQLEMGQSLRPGSSHAVIVAPAGANLSLDAGYVGTDFLLRRRHDPAATIGTQPPVLAALQALLFHEAAEATIDDHIVIWVRADLLDGLEAE